MIAVGALSGETCLVWSGHGSPGKRKHKWGFGAITFRNHLQEYKLSHTPLVISFLSWDGPNRMLSVFLWEWIVKTSIFIWKSLVEGKRGVVKQGLTGFYLFLRLWFFKLERKLVVLSFAGSPWSSLTFPGPQSRRPELWQFSLAWSAGKGPGSLFYVFLNSKTCSPFSSWHWEKAACLFASAWSKWELLYPWDPLLPASSCLGQLLLPWRQRWLLGIQSLHE